MAARLTDRQKKKIVADYLETESYNATAKKNGVCGQTVRRVVEESQGITENLKQKKSKIPPTSWLTWKASGISCVKYWGEGWML